MSKTYYIENDGFRIRAMMIDNELLVDGYYVSDQLGFDDPDEAIALYTDWEEVVTIEPEDEEFGCVMINRFAVYQMCRASICERAKEFWKWITTYVYDYVYQKEHFDELLKDMSFVNIMLKRLEELSAQKTQSDLRLCTD